MKIRRYDAHETKQMHRVDGIELGSFRARAAAIVIDCFIIVLVMVLVQLALGQLGGEAGDDTTVRIITLKSGYTAVWFVLYFGLTTYLFGGRTLGKWLLRLRVVSLAHERLTLWGCIERALGYGVSAAEFGFGFFQYFIHPNCRTVHDRIAETIVIRVRRPPAPENTTQE